MTQEEVLDAVEPYMDAVSSEYRELYGYMRDNGLYDLDILASSSTLGVTVSLPAYRSAYILSSAQGSYLDFCKDPDPRVRPLRQPLPG